MTSIRGIGCALPESALSNADLDRENPDWGMELVAELSGIDSRRVAAESETAFDLSLRACEELFERSGLEPDRVDAILYCTHDADYPMPGNSHLLHDRLGLDDRVLAFDYPLACSGFVYGLAFADAFARAGVASEILLVTAETQSRRIAPGDRSVRALLGDGAAVTHLSADDSSGGRVLASELRTHGAAFRHCYMPAGGTRTPSSERTRRQTTDRHGNVRTAEDIHMDGAQVWAFVSSTVPKHVRELLAEHSLTLDEIDLFVFHQASKMILDSLAKALEIPREKMFVQMRETGNLSSASIPFALRAALDQDVIGPGSLVLLCGFGAGMSYGSSLVRF